MANYDLFVGAGVLEPSKGLSDTNTLNMGEIPEEQRSIIEGILNDSPDFETVKKLFRELGFDSVSFEQENIDRIVVKDENGNTRVIIFGVKEDTVERSEKALPDLTDEEKTAIMQRVLPENRKNVTASITRNSGDGHQQEIDIEDLLFAADSMETAKYMLNLYGMEVDTTKPIIIERHGLGIKVIMGDETLVIDENITQSEKDSLKQARTVAEVEKTINVIIERENREQTALSDLDNGRRGKQSIGRPINREDEVTRERNGLSYDEEEARGFSR